MAIIYHIATSRVWPVSDGNYRGDTLDTQGFIHCSTADQLIAVANKFFRGRQDLTVLVIDESRVGAKIIYENLEGGTEAFPHIYGSLSTDAVINSFVLSPGTDGTFTSPPDLSGSYRRRRSEI